MIIEHMPLARQVEMAFRELKNELCQLTSGIVFMQIRNNVIGKFGVKHDPLESKDGFLPAGGEGMSEIHYHAFRQMAIDALKCKHHWTHGEIMFEFAVKKSQLVTSVTIESNYNMANLLARK